jgi:hypothetical protein
MMVHATMRGFGFTTFGAGLLAGVHSSNHARRLVTIAPLALRDDTSIGDLVVMSRPLSEQSRHTFRHVLLDIVKTAGTPHEGMLAVDALFHMELLVGQLEREERRFSSEGNSERRKP